MKELHIKLSVNELNLILESLGNQSYIKVYELIDNLQNQAKSQLSAAAAGVALNNDDTRSNAKAGAEMSTN